MTRQEPLMRRCEWIVRPPSKRRNRCLPRASTERTARPASRSGQRSRPKRGCGVSSASGTCPSSTGRMRFAWKWIVSPSGIHLRVRAGEEPGLRNRALPADQPGMRALLRRPSLLTKFSVLSLLVFVALGIGVGSMLQDRIERRALLESTKLAETMTTLGMQPILLPGDLAAGQGDDHLASLDEQLKLRDLDTLGILRLKVFNTDGVIVYSDERSIVGEMHADSPGVRRALAGEVGSKLTHGTFDDGEGQRALEVYVPLRLGGDGSPDGVVEIYLPYEPVAAAIAEDSRRLYLLLAGGLLLLYATLFRIVAVASRRLRHQALHDDLTDLPNRTLLYDRMEAALTAADRSGEPAALLLIDLDRFKEVNDTLGHDSGDRLLEEVAVRLQEVVRRGDTLARLGGDEFAVLLRGIPHRGVAAELAARLQAALARPFTLNGVVAVLDASIGIAHCPDHGTDVHTLVQRADVAMYDAKRSRTSIETYSSERDPYSAERLQLLGELRAAIGNGELV